MIFHSRMRKILKFRSARLLLFTVFYSVLRNHDFWQNHSLCFHICLKFLSYCQVNNIDSKTTSIRPGTHSWIVCGAHKTRQPKEILWPYQVTILHITLENVNNHELIILFNVRFITIYSLLCVSLKYYILTCYELGRKGVLCCYYLVCHFQNVI